MCVCICMYMYVHIYIYIYKTSIDTQWLNDVRHGTFMVSNTVCKISWLAHPIWVFEDRICRYACQWLLSGQQSDKPDLRSCPLFQTDLSDLQIYHNPIHHLGTFSILENYMVNKISLLHLKQKLASIQPRIPPISRPGLRKRFWTTITCPSVRRRKSSAPWMSRLGHPKTPRKTAPFIFSVMVRHALNRIF